MPKWNIPPKKKQEVIDLCAIAGLDIAEAQRTKGNHLALTVRHKVTKATRKFHLGMTPSDHRVYRNDLALLRAFKREQEAS